MVVVGITAIQLARLFLIFFLRFSSFKLNYMNVVDIFSMAVNSVGMYIEMDHRLKLAGIV